MGVATRAEGVVASVDGVIADVIPRTASIDGAFEQEGEADVTLAGDVSFEFGAAVLVPRTAADLATVRRRCAGPALRRWTSSATPIRSAGTPTTLR